MDSLTPLYNEDRDMIREADIGRYPEPYRSGFRRDYARLIHSHSFRRLQGKTQLFPVMESDFFRNRMSHSIEVAQIAKSIAIKLNSQQDELKGCPIDTDLVEFAALAHDLGHPPFGHNGEATLNGKMAGAGGFEGNAQTLRILTAIEQKDDEGRAGLNLTYRSLASVLKYDSAVPESPKGYYKSEAGIVDRIKDRISNGRAFAKGGFKTVECHIMDIADDIAYSTYDLEDALKAGFLSPLDIFGAEPGIRDKVAEKVRNKCHDKTVSRKDVAVDLIDMLPADVLSDTGIMDGGDIRSASADPYSFAEFIAPIKSFVDKFSKSGSYRTKITSHLVSAAINNIEFQYNRDFPELSIVDFSPEYRRRIEVLKNFVYCSIIESPRLKIAEYRGREIVETIFDALAEDGGHSLLPEDYSSRYDNADSEVAQKRVICDFIAGMTDRYAIEFYGRLKSENPQTIFKPF